jgi:uncharacterized Zn finger protein
VRRFALEHVTFAGVGDVGGDQRVVGLAIGPRLSEGAEWFVPLAEREGIGATLAHELAHAMAGDEDASGEAEVRAVTQANAWGFSDGDPAEHAARFERRQRVVRTHAKAMGDQLLVSCHECGSACRVFAPTVPGLPAEVGLECPRCGWVVARAVSDVADCAACGRAATVTWAEAATPDDPSATWTCECGTTTTLALVTAPAEVEVGPEAQDVRAAASELMDAEETLRLLGGSGDEQRAVALERCKIGMVIAIHRLRRTAKALGDDPQAGALRGMADEVGVAVSEFARRDDSAAADRVAKVAHVLNAISFGPELRIGRA